jgi:hypothetical protein
MPISKTVSSWAEFETCIDEINARWPNKLRWLFRGVPDTDWRLAPTLLRVLKPAIQAGRITTNRDIWEIEQELLRQFYQDAHNWLDQHQLPADPETDLFVSWAVMRHFGAPTRLLDWSLSAYVALFFACEDRWADSDGCVWCVMKRATDTVMAARYSSFKEFVSSDPAAPAKLLVKQIDPPAVLAMFHLKRPADRIYMQQGWFSLCSDARRDHADILEEALAEAPGHLIRITIPKVLKPEMMRRLQNINVTGRTLFPGIDGLGRSISGLARLASKWGV